MWKLLPILTVTCITTGHWLPTKITNINKLYQLPQSDNIIIEDKILIVTMVE